MAQKRWEADAPAVKQKDVRTVAGAAATGNTLSVTSALGAVYTYTFISTDTTNTIAAASFVTDFNANASDLSAEFGEVEASSSGADVTFTAKEAGKPFSFSYAGGGTSPATFAAGSGGVANSGPNVYDVAANWGGANPSGTDDLIFDQGDEGALWRLDQLASLSGTLTISSYFEADVGLGLVDDGGYPQHRARWLQGAWTVANIGAGDGNGSGRLWLYFTATNVKLNVFNTGRGTDPGIEALQVKGSGATTFDTVIVTNGEVGLAILGGDSAAVTLLQVGSTNTAPLVRGGVGCTVATLTQLNGTTILENAPSTAATIYAGTANFIRGGNIATLTIDGGTCYLGGNGSAMTVTSCTIGEGGVYDLSQGNGEVTHTNPIYCDKGGTIYDPRDRLAANTDIIPRGCTWSEITVVTGINRTWRKQA